ncbi:unnamed protein product [Allacma fusca]|uniref:Uncharacterized protein n=1 Tax=Allacma fusca TaxID=39272 RepID=A0A8J2LBX0_9HEXA|nr:unnamed protein product [Allacma fusca]
MCGTFLKNVYVIDAKQCHFCLKDFPMFNFNRRADGFRKCMRSNHLSHASWKFCRTCGLNKLPQHESSYIAVPVLPPTVHTANISTGKEDLQMHYEMELLQKMENAGLLDEKPEIPRNWDVQTFT